MSYTSWHSTEIMVHFSETPDGSSSWTRRKYPHEYVVRDTITPGGHTRWVCGSSAALERLVLWKYSTTYVKSKIGGEKISYIYLCCSSTGHGFLRINIPLDLGRFSGLSPFPTDTHFICLYTLLVNFLHSFQLFYITLFSTSAKRGPKPWRPF